MYAFIQKKNYAHLLYANTIQRVRDKTVNKPGRSPWHCRVYILQGKRDKIKTHVTL